MKSPPKLTTNSLNNYPLVLELSAESQLEQTVLGKIKLPTRVNHDYHLKAIYFDSFPKRVMQNPPDKVLIEVISNPIERVNRIWIPLLAEIAH